jgi:hypothetical protein
MAKMTAYSQYKSLTDQKKRLTDDQSERMIIVMQKFYELLPDGIGALIDYPTGRTGYYWGRIVRDLRNSVHALDEEKE